MTVSYAQMLQDDFELRDDLQEISLTNAITKTTVTGVKAKNRNLNYREVTLGASLGFEPTDQVLMLGCKSLGSAVPNRGDKATCADGTVWTLLSGVLTTFGDTPIYYEVVARKQV